MIKHEPICFITPNNFSHKAGDGVATRKHNVAMIHPAFQANCGGTQMTFLLEEWWLDGRDNLSGKYIR